MADKKKRVEFSADVTAKDLELLEKLERAAEIKRAANRERRAERVRKEIRDRYRGPLDLMLAIRPNWKRTPALELISEVLEETITTPGSKTIITMSPQEGKAVDVSTAILTTSGWTTMGELRIGDEVFHPDGHPTRVVETHAIRDDRPCYRVTTTDGRSLVVDADHLWTVADRCRRRKPRNGPTENLWETISTTALLERGLLSEQSTRANGQSQRGYRFKLPSQRSITSKPVDLPIDPWLLGAWLGDGDSQGPSISVGDSDLRAMKPQIENTAGNIVSCLWYGSDTGCWKIRFSRPGDYRTNGYLSTLRSLDLLHNKHIPDEYLAAGTEQRLALLQGLLDTDGSIFRTEKSSRVEFSSCNARLAENVLVLVRSLGWRATSKESAAVLNGREVGRRWRVTFTPQRGESDPFRMARKSARIQRPQSRGAERSVVSIVSVEPVESRPVRCITVERDDGLFLAGRDLVATHNSQSVMMATVRALQHNPDARIAYASYAEWLARRNSGEVRDVIEQYGSDAIDPVTGEPLPDLIGLSLNPDRTAEGRWQIRGRMGGATAVGIGSGLTGAAVDLLVVDDPVKDQQEADSELARSRMHDWWAAVAETRLAPTASIIVIMTRWNMDDLAGRLINEDLALPEEQREWRVVNIPALAEEGIPDALENVPEGRDDEGWMISARGNRVPRWSKVKATRPRVYYAMYAGVPTPMEGGIFQQAWLDAGRVGVEGRPPVPNLREIVVGVDPADTGLGDAAGILVAGVDLQGHQYFLADLSGPYSQMQWARKACLAWIRWGANRVVMERNLGMTNSIANAWSILRRQATALVGFEDVDKASVALQEGGDPYSADLKGLREVAPYAEAIVDAGSGGPRVVRLTPRQSKLQRAESATEYFEDGRAHLVGLLPQLEMEMITWQEGQPSPNRLDVLAMLTWHLDRGGRSRIIA